MNIFKHELRMHLKSTIIWSVSIFIYVFMAMMKYDATSTAAGSLASLIDNMPKALQVMIGGGNFDLTTPVGFFAATFLYIALLGAVHGGMLGAGILSKEERDKTSEFLLVKPVTRNRLVSYKLLSAFVLVTIISFVFFIASILAVGSSSNPFEFYFTDISRLSLGYYMIEIIFLSLGLLISTIVKKVRLAAPLTALVLFILLFFSIFAEMFEQVDFLKYLSPFSWMDAKYLLGVFSYPVAFIVISIVTVIASIIISFKLYNRKEMEI